MPVTLQNIIRFIILIPFQVLVLNNIQLSGFINPYLYILFILSLPVRTNRSLSLVLAFTMGLFIDIFSDTMGMHTFACVLIAFLRDGVIKLYLAIEEGNNPSPSFHTFGVGAYIKYVVTMVIIHHFTLFMLESFSFYHFWILTIKVLLSSLVTIILLLTVQSFKTR